jgi:predicted DNA-binding protein
MGNEDNNLMIDPEKKALLEALSEQLSKTKAELVAEIEKELGQLLGMDVRQAFDSVTRVQHIRGGDMNLDRAHKSMLVLLAHVLAQSKSRSELVST